MSPNWNQTEILPIIKDTIILLCKSHENEIITRNEVISALLQKYEIKKQVAKIRQKNQKASNIVGNMVDFVNLWVTRYEDAKSPSNWFGFASDFLTQIERKRTKDGHWAYTLHSSNSDESANFWIFVGNAQEDMTVQEMFERNMKHQYWGFKEGKANTKKIRMGDKAIIYLAGPGRQEFVASCRLHSNYLDKKNSEKREYEFPGVELTHINLWDKPILNTKQLRKKLRFIPNERNYGLRLRGGIIKITEEDYLTIMGKENEDLTEENIELELQSLNYNPPLTEAVEYTSTKTKKRSDAFRREVKENYNFTCAICERSRFAKGKPEVEAAHIFSRENNGSNDPRNGLALCKFHHWAFDNGLFSIADNYSVLVYEGITKNPQKKKEYDEITTYEGKKLKLPKSKAYWPHKKFLQKHRKSHEFK